jgi:ABC-type Mn2+/Zn2+ transport system ATPase subunit
MPAPLPIRLPDTDLAVETRELSKTYKTIAAVTKITLQVPTGAVYLLVGPNGAGKSTTIKILLDLVAPTAGSAQVMGLDPQKHAALARANVGYVPEQLNWGYAWMRTGRLLEHHARYFPSWDWSYARTLFEAFELKLGQKLGTLSKGQGRRVHLAMALAHRPPILVLDEPTDGLDPVMRDETLGVLVDHLATTPTTVRDARGGMGVARAVHCRHRRLPHFVRGGDRSADTGRMDRRPAGSLRRDCPRRRPSWAPGDREVDVESVLRLLRSGGGYRWMGRWDRRDGKHRRWPERGAMARRNAPLGRGGRNPAYRRSSSASRPDVIGFAGGAASRKKSSASGEGVLAVRVNQR